MSKTTKEKIEVMQAYEEGKQIEMFIDGNWASIDTPHWNWGQTDYRIKEEPKYRPYVDTEEMINDFCERSGAKRSKMGKPFIWVTDGESEYLILDFEKDKAMTIFNRFTMQELFESFTYCDGTPIGKKE